MNKDVIYIDTEDDITAIIGKVKESKERIVALVPPKRIGILQSAVNLRLLAKMADKSNKRLVLVTNNKALINLSAVAKIPIARSLQSKPEMAEIDILEIDEGEDVIEGEQLPVGELMKTADERVEIKSLPTNKESVADAINDIDVESDSSKFGIGPKVSELKKNKIKVPDFNRFRKILFASIAGAICLIIFFVWAIIYAPAANVIITAKTSTESVKIDNVILGTETDAAKNTVKATQKTLTQDLSVTFTATGAKNTGNKATGIVIFSNCDTSDPLTISAGTVIKQNGYSYVTQADAEVGAAKFVNAHCSLAGTSSEVAVTADSAGVAYNTSTGVEFTVSGFGSDITAYSDGGITKGTDKISAVVTADDITKATEALKKLSTDSYKQQLTNGLTADELAIAESYSVKYGDVVSTPLVGEEVADKATLKSSTVFTISAIAKSDLQTILDNELDKKITDNGNKIYSDGIDDVTLSGYLSTDKSVTVDAYTKTAKIGPNIDEAKIKELIKGKKFGDAQSILSGIPGVNDVQINFSYFWVTTMPDNVDKIDVQFILQDA